MINKIKKDYFYSKMYENGYSIPEIKKAGFFDDELDSIDYMLDFVCTPVNKLKIKEKEKNIVLLNTGSYSPIHDGHIHILNLAKKHLESKGYHVAGSYLSPSHDKYVSQKYNGNAKMHCLQRISKINEAILSEDSIMVDPWESCFVSSSINFSDVVLRMEQYLKKHLNQDITVVYVYGSDNYEFGYAFWDRPSICVERKDFKILNVYPNIEYIADNLHNEVSSSQIRINKIENCEKRINGDYLVRDDTSIVNFNGIDFSDFKLKFLKLIEETVPKGISCQLIDINHQLSQNMPSKGKTLSLDKYYVGDFNLNVSRLYYISDFQSKCFDFICRNKIPSNITVDIVDDDIISGSTIKFVKNNFNLRIDSKFALNDIYIKNNLYDIVDIRDFIIGFPHGGLMVTNVNGQCMRAPYIFPFVCLETRAKIIPSEQLMFSKKILEMNYDVYKDKSLTVSDVDDSCMLFLLYLGFSKNTKMSEVCENLIKRYVV